MTTELEYIQALAANYSTKAVMLSPASIAVLFYGLEAVKEREYWKNQPQEEISDSDADEIDEIVDTAFFEVMEAVDVTQRIVGEIAIYGSSTLPEKWLPCTGLAINRIAYAELFAVIGTTYGVGDGANTFNLPNLSNKFPKMYSPVAPPGDENAMGGMGGLSSVTLTIAQIPAHTHNGVVSPNNPVSNRALVSSGGVQTVRAAGTSDSEGGGGSHENRPPFLSLEFMIYTGVT